MARVENAFGGHLGPLDYENGLDPDANDADVIQLRKPCRVLDACRLLRDHDGYHTSVIEMSFAAIERTLEFYALTASNDTIDDFRDRHDRAYDRGAELGLVTKETARRLKHLNRENRAAASVRGAGNQEQTVISGGDLRSVRATVQSPDQISIDTV